MLILAIDPGSEQSGYVFYDTDSNTLPLFDKDRNDRILRMVRDQPTVDVLIIEMVASYGMPVGKTVFETCVYIGKLLEAYKSKKHRIYRKQVVLQLNKSPGGNDSTIRQVLIDKFGPSKEQAIGKKANPGPLYGVSNDMWQALAVAVGWYERKYGKEV